MTNRNKLHTQERLTRRIVRRTTLKGTFLVIIAALFWTTSSACGQYLLNRVGIPPEWLASTRIIAAGAILSVIGTIKNPSAVKQLFKTPKDLVPVVLYGILGMMLAQYAFLKAIFYSDSATATVLQYLGPILIIVFVCIRHFRLPTLTEAVSIVLAVGGVFMIATHGDFHSLKISTPALIWGLLTAVGMVFFSVLPAKVAPKYGSITVAGYGMLCGGIVELFIVRPWHFDVTLNFGGILAWCGVAVVGTAIGYTLYMQGVADIGPSKASMIASIEPVTSALYNMIIGTALIGWDYAGMACIIATIFVLSIPAKKLHISFHSVKKAREKRKLAQKIHKMHKQQLKQQKQIRRTQ